MGYLSLQLSVRGLCEVPGEALWVAELVTCLQWRAQQRLVLLDNRRCSCPHSGPQELTLAIGMSLLLLLVLSSPVLGLTGRLAEVRRPGLEGPVACTLCSRV